MNKGLFLKVVLHFVYVSNVDPILLYLTPTLIFVPGEVAASEVTSGVFVISEDSVQNQLVLHITVHV